jgi:hypothetical protein
MMRLQLKWKSYCNYIQALHAIAAGAFVTVTAVHRSCLNLTMTRQDIALYGKPAANHHMGALVTHWSNTGVPGTISHELRRSK